MAKKKQTLKGLTCVVTGTLPGMTRSVVHKRLRERGAIPGKAVTSKTDFVVSGSASGSKLDRARDRGIPVLNAEQLAQLLGGATLKQVIAAQEPEPEPEPIALNDAIVELRALAYETPSTKTWEAICELLDACPADTLAVAVDYVSAATGHWPQKLHTASVESGWSWGYRPGKDEERRHMPVHWVREALAGRDHPKFATARTLAYPSNKLTGKLVGGLAQCTSLSGLHGLYLSNNKIPGGFAKVLAEGPQFAQLHALNLNRNPCGKTGLKYLVKAPMMANLRALGLSNNKLEAKHAPLFAELDAPELALLQLSGNDLGEGLGAALASATLPALEHLLINYNSIGDVGATAFAQGDWSKLEQLKATRNGMGFAGLAALTSMKRASRLRVLDVSGQSYEDEAGGAAEPLLQATLPKLETLTLSNNWFGAQGAEMIAEGKAQPALRVFEAQSSGLGSAGVEALMRAPALRRLHHLSLYSNGIDDDGAELIASAPHLAQLKQLHISNNPITSEGIRALLRSPHLSALEVLDVGAYDADDADGALEALATHAPSKPRLRFVSLNTRGASKAALWALLKAPGIAHLERVNMYLDATQYPSDLIQAFYKRFR